MNIVSLIKCVSLVVGMSAAEVNAAPRIAVLDFELNDITSLPNTSTEISRTSSMAPLLMAALSRSVLIKSLLSMRKVRTPPTAALATCFAFTIWQQTWGSSGVRIGCWLVNIANRAFCSRICGYI